MRRRRAADSRVATNRAGHRLDGINAIEFLVLRRVRQGQRQTATAMTDPQMSSAAIGNEVAGPLARTCGWLALGVALVCCAPPVGIAIAIARDGIRPNPTPLWVVPLVFLCYLAFPVAFWCVGRGLLQGRVRLAAGGGLLLVGTLVLFLALFTTFD